jgi:(p)ppGpp synthase/HD superfamily hydrolase
MEIVCRLHGDDVRKGTDIPYISHLLQVAGMVVEAGGDEEQALAALLHDVLEDHGEDISLGEIREKFGVRVAGIVDDCSDAVITKDNPEKGPWRQRKEAYLARVGHKSRDSLLVSTADKVHNARAIADDYMRLGNALWVRFNGGEDGTKWYYLRLVEELSKVWPENPLLPALRREVGRFTGA